MNSSAKSVQRILKKDVVTTCAGSYVYHLGRAPECVWHAACCNERKTRPKDSRHKYRYSGYKSCYTNGQMTKPATASAPRAMRHAPGLEGVTALDSTICFIDGAQGQLVYRGYNINVLAGAVSFEEVAHLLWHGTLPTKTQLAELESSLCAERALPPMVHSILRLTPEDVDPMAAIRTCVSALAHFDAEALDSSDAANYRKALRLTARIPAIIAAFARIRRGLDPVEPLPDGSTACNFLYMLNGERPGPEAEKVLDTALVLHAEHSLNASTFAGRVIGSTLSDMYAAVTGAIGALAGPLHGGANVRVMKMLLRLEQTSVHPGDYVRAQLAKKQRIMGFGHRVYKVIDPRAKILRRMMTSLAEERDGLHWAHMCEEIRQTMEREKGINPNVDFYTGPMYYMFGIDVDLYTPIFMMSRITGWTAHLLEQYGGNRLIRPRARYTGDLNLSVVPIDQR